MKRIIDCPYFWCKAQVAIADSGKDPQPWTKDRLEGLETENLSPLIIPRHEIDHYCLTGTCPASLMHYPIRETSRHRQILDDFKVTDGMAIDEYLDARLRRGDTSHPSIPPKSQPLQQVYRINRKPPRKKDADFWQLGGREDEDVEEIPRKRHDDPPGIQGEEVGRVSIEETLGALNDSAIKLGEALAVVNESVGQLGGAFEQIEAGVGAVMGAKGNVNSETLESYIALGLQSKNEIERARALLENVPGQIAQALELGEEYAGRVQS